MKGWRHLVSKIKGWRQGWRLGGLASYSNTRLFLKELRFYVKPDLDILEDKTCHFGYYYMTPTLPNANVDANP